MHFLSATNLTLWTSRGPHQVSSKSECCLATIERTHRSPIAARRLRSTCRIAVSGKWPMTRRMARCSTVSRFSHLMAESNSKPEAFPGADAMVIRSCFGSPSARSLVVVIMATIVFVRRRLLRSACTTKAGRTFTPRPSVKGKARRTTSPRRIVRVSGTASHSGRRPPSVGRATQLPMRLVRRE